MAQRLFNALNGREMLTLLLKEVEQELALDPRFQQGGTAQAMTVLWRLRVESYPNNPGTWQLQITRKLQGGVDQPFLVSDCKAKVYTIIKQELDADERFNAHLTYPKVTWNWNLSLEFVTTGDVPRVAELAPQAVERVGAHGSKVYDFTTVRPPEATPPTPTPRILAPSGQPVGDTRIADLERSLAELRAQLLHTTGGEANTSVSEGGLTLLNGGMSPLESRSSKVTMETGTGLPIDGAWEPAPAASSAASYGGGSPLGAVAAGAVAERVELGVDHPSLEDGGVGAPDRVRRDAGLPVPLTQQTPAGMIVDLPASSF